MKDLAPLFSGRKKRGGEKEAECKLQRFVFIV